MIEGALFERIALAYWRRRATAAVTREGGRWLLPGLPEATVGQVRLCADTVTITPTPLTSLRHDVATLPPPEPAWSPGRAAPFVSFVSPFVPFVLQRFLSGLARNRGVGLAAPGEIKAATVQFTEGREHRLSGGAVPARA